MTAAQGTFGYCGGSSHRQQREKPMPRELIFADDAIVALIVTEGIAPRLKRIESEVHRTVRVSVHQWAGDEERACGFCGPMQADHEGVARILCRPTSPSRW
jgi:hypothetical protein